MNKKIKKIFFAAVFVLFMQGCVAHKAIVKEGYDFTAIKSVKVGKFVSENNYSNSGSAVRNEFIRQLLAGGYNVKTGRGAGADVIIRGSVTAYVPDKKYLVRYPDRDDFYDGYVYVDEIVEISGSTIYNAGQALGMSEPNKIMASNAVVGISAYMEDADSGEIVWSDSYTYEGLDLSSALEGAVKYILKSISLQKSQK